MNDDYKKITIYLTVERKYTLSQVKDMYVNNISLPNPTVLVYYNLDTLMEGAHFLQIKLANNKEIYIPYDTILYYEVEDDKGEE